jgi:trimeric autotransporter adhesin
MPARKRPCSSATRSGCAVRLTLDLLPPGSLEALSLNPATVIGGESSTGTVTLSSPAPAGGRVVSLSSHDTTVATVPASVIVPAGASSATFTVSTKVVCCEGHFSIITAEAGGITRTASIGVNPAPSGPTLASLALSPTTVVGGGTSTGTVTLTEPAPAGGRGVELRSSNTQVATVPQSAIVAAGQTTATFTVSTSAVAASTPVTISAWFFNERQAVLTVNPPGASPPPRRYRGEFSWSSNPGSVTVKSSLGGSASRTVTLK